MSWNPEDDGADCQHCPLRSKRAGVPVKPELRAGSTCLLIGQEPGMTEAMKGRPFVGPAGSELERTLRHAGIQREQVSIDLVVACAPAGKGKKLMKGGLTTFLGLLKTRNARVLKTWRAAFKAAVLEAKAAYPDWWRKAKEESAADAATRRKDYVMSIVGEPELTKSPVTCCAPRLRRTIDRQVNGNVIPLGSLALRSVTGRSEGILKLRGDVMVTPAGGRAVPTFNPAAILHGSRHLRWVVDQDFGKALRYFRGQLQWNQEEVDSRIEYNPTVERLRKILFSIGRSPVRWTYDWETTREDPMIATPKCISIGWKDRMTGLWHAAVIGIRDAPTITYFAGHITLPSGEVRPAGEHYWNSCKELLRKKWQVDDDGWESTTSQWFGQNAGSFDRQVSEAHIGYYPHRLIDLLLLHRAAFPQLKHNLLLIGTTLLDVGAWKIDEARGAAMAESDDNFALWHYCGMDSIITGMCIGSLLDGDQLRGVRPLMDGHYFRLMPVGG